jgi:hypothetical protein
VRNRDHLHPQILAREFTVSGSPVVNSPATRWRRALSQASTGQGRIGFVAAASDRMPATGAQFYGSFMPDSMFMPGMAEWSMLSCPCSSSPVDHIFF